jgi:hypothetical protein
MLKVKRNSFHTYAKRAYISSVSGFFELDDQNKITKMSYFDVVEKHLSPCVKICLLVREHAIKQVVLIFISFEF